MIYSELLPERLKEFPQPDYLHDYVVSVDDQAANCVATSGKIDKDSLCSLPWSHELRHDAESCFWLLVWWAIHLCPESPPSSNSDIFGYLTKIDLANGTDPRVSFIQWLDTGTSWLDPQYQELVPLFLQMADQLRGDLYWAKYGGTAEMKDPEFLHEALQLIIFNFLMENKTKPFMKLEKDPNNHRESERQIPQHAEKQFTPSKRSYNSMADESEVGGEVSHLPSPALVHTTYSCRGRVRSALGPIRHVGRLRSLEEDESRWVFTTMTNFLVERWIGWDDRRLGRLRRRKVILVISPSDSWRPL